MFLRIVSYSQHKDMAKKHKMKDNTYKSVVALILVDS